MACLDNQVTCETTRYILCLVLLFMILCTLRQVSFRISFCVLWMYAFDVILHVLLILRISILCFRWFSIPIYLISWSTTSSLVDFHFFLQISFISTSENITKFSLNHDQLLYNSSIITQMSDKMTEKQIDNNLRWHVIITLDLNCLLSSSNEIAQIINLRKFCKEHTFQKRFLRSSSIRFPWLTNLYTSMQGGYS